MFVYAIAEEAAALVKIGRAKHPRKRLGSLRTASPADLAIRACWDGNESDEKALHAAFGSKRVRGEWFDFGDDDPIAAVTKVLGREPVPAAGHETVPTEKAKRGRPPAEESDQLAYARWKRAVTQRSRGSG